MNLNSQIAVLIAFCLLLASSNGAAASAALESEGMTLVFEDTFEGDSLDLRKWHLETGTGVNGEWGTGQLDRATDRPENVRVENGKLVITAAEERYIDRDYTSGRVLSRDRAYFRYGRIEARVKAEGIRCPGQGFAFWMMPQYSVEGAWPRSGEIDIMEYVANRPYHNLGSVHFAWYGGEGWDQGRHGHYGRYFSIEKGAYSGDPLKTDYQPGPGVRAMSEEYHIYALDWNDQELVWSVNDIEYHRRPLSEVHHDGMTPFHEHFFLILSIGVGGSPLTYGGPIVDDAVFPASVYVDWVRVYQDERDVGGSYFSDGEGTE